MYLKFGTQVQRFGLFLRQIVSEKGSEMGGCLKKRHFFVNNRVICRFRGFLVYRIRFYKLNDI